jgi:hypothetical protein
MRTSTPRKFAHERTGAKRGSSEFDDRRGATETWAVYVVVGADRSAATVTAVPTSTRTRARTAVERWDTRVGVALSATVIVPGGGRGRRSCPRSRCTTPPRAMNRGERGHDRADKIERLAWSELSVALERQLSIPRAGHRQP